MQPWTPDDLQAYLNEQHIPATIIHMTVETPTVPAAADALAVPVDQIVKTVIFFINGQPYAVIANGVRRVDTKKLAEHFQINRKKVKLAGGEAVTDLTGYPPGTVPPIGHRQTLPILMDPAIRQHEVVYAGGGGIAAMLRIRSDDLERLTHAEMLDVLES
jgi:Cys-tRNA(Pro) deacylase